MRPSILAGSIALFGWTSAVQAQVIYLQQAWNPVPIVIVPAGIPVPTIPAQNSESSNSESSTSSNVSKYGKSGSVSTLESRDSDNHPYPNKVSTCWFQGVVSTPVPLVMTPPPPVRLERYYFMPSAMEPVVPPSSHSTAAPKGAVASPFGEVIIREYFVMDRPDPSRMRNESTRESTPATTPRNSSQGNSPESNSEKLDKPKWSEEFDKTDTTPESGAASPAPVESKEAPASPAEEPKKDPTPPAEEESKDKPTDPIAPAEPPPTTPRSST